MHFIIILFVISGIFFTLKKTLPSFSQSQKIRNFFHSIFGIGLFFICFQWIFYHDILSFWIHVTIGSFMIYFPFSLYMKQQFWKHK